MTSDDKIIKAFLLHATRLHLREAESKLSSLTMEAANLEGRISMQQRIVEHHKSELRKLEGK